MALDDTFIRTTPSRQANTLTVTVSGKYWRMDYRFADKRKTLALGVYPAITL
jgi:hypothetical protein